GLGLHGDIGGGVGVLADTAENGAAGGEQHEHVRAGADLGERVGQCACALDLGAVDRGDAVAVQRGDAPVVQDARGVEDAAQRVFRAVQLAQQRGHGGGVGDIAAGGGDLDA